MKKKYLILGLIVLVCGGFYFYTNVLYKDARNIQTEKSSFTLSSKKMLDEYKTDIAAADSKYLNKTIEIEGKVTDISDSSIVLDSVIFCSFDKKDNATLNKKIKVKGRCIGFDEMFNEVKFDQCTILE
jgi:hypothetical protein